jgi:predicted DNA-binding transcriptional regulator AlpA
VHIFHVVHSLRATAQDDMPEATRPPQVLPATAFMRQSQIIGERPVTPEQAEANRERGKGPRRARMGIDALLPISSATFWRKVKAGEFPAPVKLSERVTAWRCEDVRKFLDAQASK